MICVILFQYKFAFKQAQYLQYLNLQFNVYLFSILLLFSLLNNRKNNYCYLSFFLYVLV